MQNWVQVGKVKDAQGLNGELFLFLFAREAPWLKKLRDFALAPAEAGPYKIWHCDRVRVHKEGLVIKAPGIEDRNQAEALKGQIFFVPADFLQTSTGETIYLREIKGFTVKTETEVVGPIQDFSSNGPQDLLLVDRGGTLVEIPFVEAFLKEIDFENKTVLMDLPEGLWEP